MIAEILKEDFVKSETEKIPIQLLRTDLGDSDHDDFDLFSVEVNQVEWFVSDSKTRAEILFAMMKDHLQDFFSENFERTLK